LPTKFDIHEYSIMEKFCYSVKNEQIADALCNAIRGSGAFRRFKDEIQRRGIAEDWYKFRGEAILKIARDWCEANEIDYIDDHAAKHDVEKE